LLLTLSHLRCPGHPPPGPTGGARHTVLLSVCMGPPLGSFGERGVDGTPVWDPVIGLTLHPHGCARRDTYPPATFSTNHSASSSTGARPLYSDWDAVVASVYSFLLDCAVFCVVIPVETPPMMHVPSTSKRSTCFTALSYFLMRPQLLTR
jgi:hypothetical protein